MSTHLPWKTIMSLSPSILLYNQQPQQTINTLLNSTITETQIDSIEPIYISHFIKLLQCMCYFYINHHQNAFIENQTRTHLSYETQINNLNLENADLKHKLHILNEQLSHNKTTITNYQNVINDMKRKIHSNKQYYKLKLKEIEEDLKLKENERILEKLVAIQNEFWNYSNVNYVEVKEHKTKESNKRSQSQIKNVHKNDKKHHEDISKMYNDIFNVERKLKSSQSNINNRLISIGKRFNSTKHDLIGQVEELKQKEKENYYNSLQVEVNSNQRRHIINHKHEIIIMSSDECIEDKTKYVLNQRHSVTLLEDQLKYNEIDIKQNSFENKHNELGTKLNTNNNSNNIKEIKIINSNSQSRNIFEHNNNSNNINKTIPNPISPILSNNNIINTNNEIDDSFKYKGDDLPQVPAIPSMYTNEEYNDIDIQKIIKKNILYKAKQNLQHNPNPPTSQYIIYPKPQKHSKKQTSILETSKPQEHHKKHIMKSVEKPKPNKTPLQKNRDTLNLNNKPQSNNKHSSQPQKQALNNNNNNNNNTPSDKFKLIYTRFENKQKQKDLKIQTLRKEQETKELNNVTCIPKINLKSKQMVKSDFYDRLETYEEKRKANHNKLKTEIENKKNEEIIYPKCKLTLNKEQKEKMFNNKLNEFQKWDAKKKEKIEQLKKAQFDKENRNNNIHTNKIKTKEDIEICTKRLYEDEINKRKERNELLNKMYEITFVPSINKSVNIKGGNKKKRKGCVSVEKNIQTERNNDMEVDVEDVLRKKFKFSKRKGGNRKEGRSVEIPGNNNVIHEDESLIGKDNENKEPDLK